MLAVADSLERSLFEMSDPPFRSLGQVWLCVGHMCSDETNTCALPDDPFCFVYDEKNKDWIQW